MADLVTRLQASADYVDDMKTRVRDGALTIFEEGSQKLFREAATALSAVSTENARLEKAVKDLSDEIDNLEEEGCGVDDTIRKLSDRATAAEAAIARLRDEVEWKPIETAPKHQSIILCFWWRRDPTAPFVAEGFLDWDGVTWCHQGDKPLCADHLPPTHWMPLPAAPLKETHHETR